MVKIAQKYLVQQFLVSACLFASLLSINIGLAIAQSLPSIPSLDSNVIIKKYVIYYDRCFDVSGEKRCPYEINFSLEWNKDNAFPSQPSSSTGYWSSGISVCSDYTVNAYCTYIANSTVYSGEFALGSFSGSGATIEQIKEKLSLGYETYRNYHIKSNFKVSSGEEFTLASAAASANLDMAYVPQDEEIKTRPTNNPKCEGDPVYLHSGQFFYQCNDLSIPGRKTDFNLEHTYYSGMSFNGPFGYGWMINYYMRLHRLRGGDVIIVSGDGQKTRYEYNGTEYVPLPGKFENLSKNPDNTWTLTLAQGEEYAFDIDGKLISIKDRNGNTITFSYDTSKRPHYGKNQFAQDPLNNIMLGMDNRLTQITDTTGRNIQLIYSEAGYLDKIIDGNRQISFAYDGNNDLLSVTKPATQQFPSGLTKSFEYENHNVRRVRDPKLQYFVTNIFDQNGRVKEQQLGEGSFFFDYSAENQVTETNRNGFITKYTFNPLGNMIKREQFASGLRLGEPESYVTMYDYNSASLKTAETFPRGNGIKYMYDSLNPDPRSQGNLLQIRKKQDMSAEDNDATDIITAMTYEPRFNQIKTLTDPKNNQTLFKYDYELHSSSPDYGEAGDLVEIAWPAVQLGNPITSFSYNDYGQVTKTIDPNGNVTAYEYYPNGYLWKTIEDPDGINAITELVYDAYGNVNSIKDANDRTTQYVYNELNWLLEETNPLGYKTKYTHDANGNVSKIEKQADEARSTWQTTSMTYDVLNHLKTITDPLNRTTTFNYDANENQVAVIDAEGNATSSIYDERNLQLSVIDANTPTGITKFDYDLNGNLAKITDANGNSTTYAYNLFDRRQSLTYADGKSKYFTYDKNNNLEKVNLPGGKFIDFEYDVLNRMTSKSTSTLNLQPSTFEYDLGSRLTDANNASAQIHYEYDHLNRIQYETQTVYGIQHTVYRQYDKAGNRTQLTYPSGKILDYVYDANDQLDSIKEGAATIADFDYDILGRRSTKTTSSILHTTYSYDSANQLTTLTNSLVSDGSLISKYEYPIYDNAGNRKQMIRTLLSNSPTTINYTYNNIYELTTQTVIPAQAGIQNHTYDYDAVNNREVADGEIYTTNTVNQYTKVNGVDFTYDSNGNLTNDGTNTFTFNEENQLSQISGLLSAVYEFDALGRRVSKTIDGSKTFYIYDGDSIIADYNESGSLEAEYLLSDNIDEVLAMELGSSKYYYNYDGLGSVTEITSPTGSLVEAYTYAPYGQPTIYNSTGVILTPQLAGEGSQIDNRYMFTGREWDAESGLYHYRARVYSSTIGRFLQRDPKEYEGGMNAYTYAYNNPTNFVDPDGELAFLALIPILYAAFEAGLSVSDVYSTGSTLLDPCASTKTKLFSAGLFMMGAIAPGGGYSSSLNFTKGQLKQFEKQLAQHGKKSLEKSLSKLKKKLTDHEKKIEEIKKVGGYTSSIEKEIKNFKQQINAIKEIISGG